MMPVPIVHLLEEQYSKNIRVGPCCKEQDKIKKIPRRKEDVDLELEGGGPLRIVGEQHVGAGQLTCGTRYGHNTALQAHPGTTQASPQGLTAGGQPPVLQVGGIAGGRDVEDVGLALREFDG